VLSSLFSVYKFRNLVQERVHKLVAAGIKPTLKHVVFLDRAFSSHSKREKQLLSVTEPAASFDMNGNTSSPARDGEDVGLMRDFQLQMQQTRQEMKQQQQQQQQQMQQEMKQQQQQMQQEMKQQQQQMQQEMKQQQQQMQQEMKQQQLLLQAVQDQLLALQIKLPQST
jgi:septin family protein